MGKVLADEDEITEPEGSLGPDDELLGTPDGDDLAIADIGDGPEEIGLDTESGAYERADVSAIDLLDELDDEDGVKTGLDDAQLDLGEDLDLDDDEDGWTEESEGLGGSWDEDLGIDDELESGDDGGLEGVDDPLLDGLELEDEPGEGLTSKLDDDDDDGFDDGGEGTLGEESLPELA